MRYQMTHNTSHVEIPEGFDEYVAREIAKLDPIVASFPDDTLLRVLVEDASGVDDVEVLLRLSLSDRLLTTRETGSLTEIQSVFGTALKALRRQILDYKR